MAISRSAAAAAAVLITGSLVLTGCVGTGGHANSGKPVIDGTLTFALPGDPGTLDPQTSQSSAANSQMARFLYDPLVNILDGKVVSGLADTWVETDNEIVFTLHDGITCADGSPLSASDVADNINYIGDETNLNPLGGYVIPLGTTATADDDANTVTMTTPAVTGFLLNTLPLLPIVCASGLADRESLGTTPAGTGPYRLTDSVAGNSWTLERRDDYAWGPDGGTTSEAGVPKTIQVSIGSNETTAANQLVAGQLDIATVSGPDALRLESAKMFATKLPAVLGQLFYNEASDRVTADPDVRKGLTLALDFDQLREVAGSGQASDGPAFTGLNICGSDLTKLEPKQDVAAAKALLEGKDLGTLNIAYGSYLGPSAAASAELMAQELEAVGVKTKTTAVGYNEIESVIYQNADFDITIFGIDGTTPGSIQSSVSGSTPAEGGSNFASIDDPDYNRLSAQAAILPGDQGCDLWNQADEALVKSWNAIVFADSDFIIWGGGASFSSFFGAVLPTTIRQTS